MATTDNGTAATKKAIKKKASKKAVASVKVTKKAASDRIHVPDIKAMMAALGVISLSPMYQHQWSEKALQGIRDKQQGKKTKNRDPRDTVAEGEAAMYRTLDGKPGIPLIALKKAMITAAHKDLGIEKTLVKKAIFVPFTNNDPIAPIECLVPPIIKEDPVRLSGSAMDLRYRPYFEMWRATVRFIVDTELITIDDFVKLVTRAGFGVGIGDWRPENGGEFGRFKVDESVEVVTMEVK